MLASLLYALARLVLELLSVRGAEDAALRAEVLALRRQVQVLERQIKRVHWTPGDRMMLAALNRRLPNHPGQGCWSSRRRCLAGMVNWFGADGLPTAAGPGGDGHR